MKLVTYCDSCKNEIKIKSNSNDRPELAKEKGDEFVVNCPNCGNNSPRHVNDIRAVQNNIILLGGVLIGVIVTIALLLFLGAIGTISLVIPFLIWQQQNKAISTFNGYMLTRR